MSHSTAPLRVIKTKSARRQKTKSSGYAIVKAVLSGDSLVLMGNPTLADIPAEKEVSISGIRAPNFPRSKNSADKEEPWAWHSREFLRKKVIGLVVKFQVVYRAESGREYVNLFLGDENLASSIVSAGWARVPVKEDEKLVGERAALFELQQQAEAQGLGVHNKSVNPLLAVRALEWNAGLDFYTKNKDKTLHAVLDKVVDGSTFRAEVVGQDGDILSHTILTVRLAGVECNATPLPQSVIQQQNEQKKKDNPNFRPRKEKPLPFSLEAQSFVEQRLLHRDVSIVIKAIDKSNNFFAAVVYHKGDIAERIVSEGLGRVVRWSAPLTGHPEKLNKAQDAAKQKKLRLWTGFHEGKNAQKEEKHEGKFNGRIVSVLNGDRVVVIPEGSQEEQKYTLASIRAPKLGARGFPDEPCAFDAREFLRKKLVGKDATFVVEYIRPPQPDLGINERTVAVSLYLGKENVGESLVAEGFARVINHRVNEDRAANYDRLLLAENGAIKESRGIFAAKHPPAPAYLDLSLRGANKTNLDEAGKPDRSNARLYFETLSREKGQQGIVEYVSSASRFKIRIPKHNIIIPFFLSAVQAPKTAGAENDWPAVALAFAKAKALQRNVSIQLEGMDKYDNFIGNLFIEKINFGVSLLAEGLGSLVGNYDRNKYGRDLKAAQEQAKQANIGLWKDYVEPAAAVSSSSAEEDNGDFEEEKEKPQKEEIKYDGRGAREGTDVEVRVTEIVDATTFYVQYVQDENVPFIEASMNAFGELESIEFDDIPAVGTIAAGLYNDGQWYRVKVEGRNAEGQVKTHFIDYGNHELLDAILIRQLDAEVAAIPALARLAVLSGIKAPAEKSDYYDNAGHAFSSLVWDKELVAHIDLVEGGKLHVTLNDPEDTSSSVNQKLLEGGWARIQNRPPWKLKEMVQGLRDFEQDARDAHRGIWEYGDVSDEEESAADDRGRVPLKRGASDQAKGKKEKKDDKKEEPKKEEPKKEEPKKEDGKKGKKK